MNAMKILYKELKTELFILEMLKNRIPTNIFLMLSAYGELSLKSLSELVGKSKATILRHTRLMVEYNVIVEYSKEDDRSKYFKLHPKRFTLSTPEIILPYIKKMNQEERKEMYTSMIAFDKSNIHVMKYILDIVLRYMDFFNETKTNIDISEDMIKNMFNEMDLYLTWDMYDRNTFELYQKHQKIFYENLKKDIDKYLDSRKIETNDGSENLNYKEFDYIRWNIVVPLKKLLKFSQNK